MADLHGLLGSKRTLLFDFDGPICDLYARRPAHEVARRIRKELVGQGHRELLQPDQWRSRDPLQMVRQLTAATDDHALRSALWARLTEEESAAAQDASLTDFAAELILELVRRDFQVAVTTNNSPRAVRIFLDRHGLIGYFGESICGREENGDNLKPKPDCLHRALELTNTPAAAALMIGDAVADLEAAANAGVAFLGFAPNGSAGAPNLRQRTKLVVPSHYPLVQAVRRLDPAPTHG